MANKFKTQASYYKPAEVKTNYGKLTPRQTLSDSTTGSEWSYVQKAWDDRYIDNGPDQCAGWRGSYHRQGMGLFQVKRNDGRKNGMMTIQRFAAARQLGRPLKEDEYVVNTCANPECANPAHLVYGPRSVIKQRQRQNSFPIEWYQENKDLILNSTGREIMQLFGMTQVQAGNLKGMLRARIRKGQIV